jgi:hypothetical protein
MVTKKPLELLDFPGTMPSGKGSIIRLDNSSLEDTAMNNNQNDNQNDRNKHQNQPQAGQQAGQQQKQQGQTPGQHNDHDSANKNQGGKTQGDHNNKR